MEVVFTSRSLLKEALPTRDPWAHKGNFGRVLIVAGSLGYTGAPVLTSQAALRTGSGLIFTLVPERVYPVVAGKLTEPMVFPAPSEDGRFSDAAAGTVCSFLETCDICVLGPGLGRSGAITNLVLRVLAESRVPVVLDADGINAAAGHIDKLKEARCPVILTPHDGEFARLGGCLTRENRREQAAAMARETGCVVVLKGHETLITDGVRLYQNTTGNPGMATGGSGDVLSGVIASLIGQGLDPLTGAAAGVWLHGAAGDLCQRELGQEGLTPTDMIRAIPRVLKTRME